MQPRWTELGKAKLASSGLTVEDGKKLGMQEIASAIKLHKDFEARPALVLNYKDLKGKPASADNGWPEFFRIRYLDKGTGFADMAAGGGGQRYAQPANTGVCAYLPSVIDWQEVASNIKTPILITEGELKAASAAVQGWACIGLGGVWNFRMARHGHFFLPELEKIDWGRRDVYVVYDSDYREKPQVALAINAIASELVERGALVKVTTLPDITDDEDGKTGLDDFLVAEGAEAFEEVLAASTDITLGRALWKFNDKIAYIRDPGIVVELQSSLKMSPAAFKEHSDWSTVVTPEASVSADGDIIYKKAPAAARWLKWPLRRSLARITYAPGQERITSENEYNQWAGWGVEPVKGNVRPFMELVRFLFKDMPKENMEWFLDWCAYPIQNPGVKMFTSVVVWGPYQGTGKSLIGYTLGEIYGVNFKEITNEELEGSFTGWAENKQFIMGDEITGNDNRKQADKLKRLITQRVMTIDAKFMPVYSVPDCINYYFTSNHADAFFMSDMDRRMFIAEVQGPAMAEAFYEDYDNWLWRGNGPAHLMHWLMQRKITKSFSPHGNAPLTSAKKRMLKASKGELTGWISDLLETPDQFLVIGKMEHTRDMFTSSELLSMYKSAFPDAKASAMGIGKALSNAGVLQADGGQPLRGHDGKQGRYYIIRNPGRWVDATRKQIEKHLQNAPVPKAGRKI